MPWLLAAFCAAAPAHAQMAAPLPAGPSQVGQVSQVSQVRQVEGITEYRLPNGLQVLLVPDDSKPTTTVNLTYRSGSRHEGYGETGMAHLLEHLIFKGTPTTPNVREEFSRRGLRTNGTTWFDRTNYFASFAANDDSLRWYLSWLADSMTNSFIRRADLDSEMTVVRNEFESGENSPTRVTLQQVMASMYRWHNYGKSTIGARSDIENVDIARLQAFYRKHYQPDNATLVVAGKFDAAQVLAWTAQFYGPIPRPTRVLETTYTLDPVQDGEREVTVRRVGGNPLVYAAWHVVPAAHPDFAPLQLLSQVLSDSPGGRLHRALVQRQLAASAGAFAWGLAEPGPFFASAQLAPGQDVAAARAALLATIDALAAEPVTAEELERVRTQWLNAWDRGFTDPERIGVSISEAIASGDWRLYFWQRDRLRAATLADVQRVAAAYLKRDNRTIGTYLPTERPDRAPEPPRVDVAALLKDYRGDPAAAATAEAFDPTPANLQARTQSFTLPSGLKASLLPRGARGRLVQARLSLQLGDVDSLRGEVSVAALAGALINKGGAGLTRQQINDRFDALRADVSFGASAQVLSVGITTVREHLPATLELVGRLLRDPVYPADALEELRRQSLAGIERSRKEPSALIAQQLARHGNPYPRGDLRYASSFDERVQDLQAVTPERLRAFHRRFVSAASGQFAAVGDMDVAAVRAALQAAFGGWSAPAAGALPYLRVPQPRTEVPPQRFLIETPDRANANLLATMSLPISDNDADFVPLLMANYLLGGRQGSRLFERVRGTEGLSYDVRSGISFNRFEPNSDFELSAIFAPGNRARVETAVREVLATALRDGFTAAEVDNGRAGLLSLRRLSRAQTGTVVSQLIGFMEIGRNFALSQQVDDAIGRLTPAQVNAALRKYIDPARLSFAWGGDFKTAAP